MGSDSPWQPGEVRERSMYSTPCSSMLLRRWSWISRRRRSWRVRVEERSLAGERRPCHCARVAMPAGSMMASSTAIVPFAMLEFERTVRDTERTSNFLNKLNTSP